MTNQAMIPKKGLNILDSMFNQLWELGEVGPNISLPGWCQQAIDCINGFEDAMTDAWDEVYDCWEREFITRLWRIEVEHHGGGEGCPKNHKYMHENTVTTQHDHTHPVIGSTAPSGGDVHSHPVNIESQPSGSCDSSFQMTSELIGHLTCPGHLDDLLKPVCVCYRKDDIEPLAKNYRSDLKNLCQWMTSAIEAIGLKFAAISTVMSDPSLNGKCCNNIPLAQINELREKNNELLTKVEKAYGLYSNVDNMKNKKEYDEEIALHELQPNKYSNEDQLNISSSIQSESNQLNLDGKVCKGGIMKELQPWNHMSLKENKVTPKCIPSKCVCNKFDKVIESVSGFESWTIEN